MATVQTVEKPRTAPRSGERPNTTWRRRLAALLFVGLASGGAVAAAVVWSSDDAAPPAADERTGQADATPQPVRAESEARTADDPLTVRFGGESGSESEPKLEPADDPLIVRFGG